MLVLRIRSSRVIATSLLLLMLVRGNEGAEAQDRAPPPEGVSRLGAEAPQAPMMRLSGVWIEGPGYDITYGRDYDACERRCLTQRRCIMIEYYKPEKKCNLYSSDRRRLVGGSSIVALRQPELLRAPVAVRRR